MSHSLELSTSYFTVLNEVSETPADSERTKPGLEPSTALGRISPDSISPSSLSLSVVQGFKNLCLALTTLAQRVCHAALAILLYPAKQLAALIESVTRKVIDLAFFSAFSTNRKIKESRTQKLLQGIRKNTDGTTSHSPHAAYKLETDQGPLISPDSLDPIDALYFRSASPKRNGHAVLFVLGKDYQHFHPRNFDHLLDDGVDVVLFNPTSRTLKAMAADLRALVEELTRKNPQQQLAFVGHCIGSHVAASVASDWAQDKNVSLPVVIDRGFGDGYELARKINRFAALPYPKSYIQDCHNARAIEKIHQHRGPMLFFGVQEGEDQLMHPSLKNGKIKNFTKELFETHCHAGDVYVELQNVDHWTPWTYAMHQSVKEFLFSQGILPADYRKFDAHDTGGFPRHTPVPWARKYLLPLIV